MADKINPGDPRAADVRLSLERLLLEIAESPTDAPRYKAALARRIGVDQATLWRHAKADQTVEELIEQVIRTGRAGRLWDGSDGMDAGVKEEPAPLILTETGGNPLTTLPDQELEQRALRAVQKAKWALQRFAERAGKKYRHISDLPRSIYYLEKSLAEARNTLSDLRPLADEWLRRRDGLNSGTPDPQQDLRLD